MKIFALIILALIFLAGMITQVVRPSSMVSSLAGKLKNGIGANKGYLS